MIVQSILDPKGGEIITMPPSATVIETAHTLRKHRIGAVLVCEEDGAIAGIMSERDIVRALCSKGTETLELPISDLMTREVVTCTRQDKINELMSLMTEKRIRHLPVVEGTDILGMISIGDVVKSRIEETEREAEALKEYIATA